jgi:hypothetical protein
MWASTTALNELTAELTRVASQEVNANAKNTNSLIQAINTDHCTSIVDAIDRSAESRDIQLSLLTAAVNNIAAILRRSLFRPPNPGPLKIVVTAEVPCAESVKPDKD